MGYEISDKIWTGTEFAEYLSGLPEPGWDVKGVTFHHTGFPDLRMRPNGLQPNHQKNLRHYYEKVKKWSDGPHLFIDDDSVIGMSGLLDDGVHAVGFNRTHIGIEVLGDYDREDPKSGRGRDCWNVAFAAAAEVLRWLGLKVTNKTVTFHREDGYTRKTCPGRLVDKLWVMDHVEDLLLKETVIIPSGSKDPSKPDLIDVPPRVPGWRLWKQREGGWFVPVLAFLDHIGGDPEKIIGDMKSVNGKLYYQGDLIENAFYCPEEETTYALAKELLGFT